ncbi:MAG: hypothetical protein COA58_16880 [Bacteroidetes bacterium]|nr:MAG: hypothetical protein COA58_16880 [Bacteroidota bacterium]
MIRTIIISTILLFFANRIYGLGVSDTIRAEQFSPTRIVGTYGGDRVYYKFKANKKCKLRYVAPRSLVYCGEWEILNDTLICTFNRVNTIGQGDNDKLQNNPIVEKFIIYTGKLYNIRKENGQISLMLVPKTE